MMKSLLSLFKHHGLMREIGLDLARHSRLVVLTGLVIGSALVVVEQAYDYRNLMAEREALKQERDTLDVEWRHLTVEQNALSEHSRVERIALKELNMHHPSKQEEVLVPWR